MSLDIWDSLSERERASFDKVAVAECELEDVLGEYISACPDDAAMRIVQLERELLDESGFCVHDCGGDFEAYNFIVCAHMHSVKRFYRKRISKCLKARKELDEILGGDA